MLSHLSVENYAIASHLEMEFDCGMTVITGETGAGKSIMLDALGLALGDRGDARVIRRGSKSTDIHATFDITAIPLACQWLDKRELLAGNECLLRRVVTSEGRSRGYINGRPATLQDLKALGNLLIDIHSQHAHQSLLKKEQQRQLLDDYAGLAVSSKQLATIAQSHQRLQQQLRNLENNRSEQNARAQLLGYQVEELDKLALTEGELDQLELEQKQLANGESILAASQHALALCKEGELNVVSILGQALRSLGDIDSKSHALSEAEQLLASALIQAEEAGSELQLHIDGFELSPERLRQVENRLNSIYEVARKHRINASQILNLQQQLQEELDSIIGSDSDIEQLQTKLSELTESYRLQAGKISKKRRSAAKKLQNQVELQLQALAMDNCCFSVELSPRSNSIHSHGSEEIAFLISTNPGQPPQSLGHIASGGELSRISLAIQVVTAQTSATPTLVFDEVDVGIGGATAEVVGNLLRELGTKGQVLCVTHQAQVASKGHQHLFVSKDSRNKPLATQLQALEKKEKIEEIARMLGGIDITDRSRAHAREMLAVCH